MTHEDAMALFEATQRSFAPVAAQLKGLADLPPGPDLIANLVRLQSVDLDCSCQTELVVQWGRVEAWSRAQAVKAWSGALAGGDHDSDRLIAHEIAAATHLSEGSAFNRQELVSQLTHSLPPALSALNDGRLSLDHVRALAEATRNATDELAHAVAERVVPRAIARGWTPRQIKDAAQRLIMRLDPEGAAERHRRAKDDEDVGLYGSNDDMATVSVTTDAPTARQIMDTLEARAAELQRAGDERPIGQLRVAAFASAVLGEGPSRPAAEVIVTVDLTTLLGLNETPGELSGYGPITADLARQLAADATLRRLVTDPMTGMSVDLGRTSYRPSKLLKRILAARDRVCRFPGCQKQAIDCDNDHIAPWNSHGETATHNMHALCRMHHNLKTNKAWRVSRDEVSGTSTWISPFGSTYKQLAATYPIDGLDPPRRAGPRPDEVASPTSQAPLPSSPIKQRLAIVIESHIVEHRRVPHRQAA